jgi:hypothetical protein
VYFETWLVQITCIVTFPNPTIAEVTPETVPVKAVVNLMAL